MICSAQTIRRLCGHALLLRSELDMHGRRLIDPMRAAYRAGGMSGGLGPAGYDIALAQDVVVAAGCSVLASAVEHFDTPNWLLARVHDKSSWRRRFLSVGNTVIEPGWRGHLTLELSNHNADGRLEIAAGTPIAQVVWEYLDAPTDIPYAGKYQDQTAAPQEALLHPSHDVDCATERGYACDCTKR